MTITETTIDPAAPDAFVPLATWLDQGNDPRISGYYDWPHLLGYVLTWIDSTGGEGRMYEMQLAQCRQWFAETGRKDFPATSAMPGAGDPYDDYYRFSAWALEVVADRTMVPRLVALLSAEEVARMESLRAEALSDLYDDLHPFSFELGEAGSYRCALSGERFDGVPLVLVARGAYGDGFATVSSEPVAFQPEALLTHLADLLRVTPEG
jgi:hypothetical protein